MFIDFQGYLVYLLEGNWLAPGWYLLAALQMCIVPHFDITVYHGFSYDTHTFWSLLVAVHGEFVLSLGRILQKMHCRPGSWRNFLNFPHMVSPNFTSKKQMFYFQFCAHDASKNGCCMTFIQNMFRDFQGNVMSRDPSPTDSTPGWQALVLSPDLLLWALDEALSLPIGFCRKSSANWLWQCEISIYTPANRRQDNARHIYSI